MTIKRNQILKDKKREIVEQGEEEAIDPVGVDVTLIRWMLSMTPQKRLETLQDQVRNIERLRKGLK